LGAVSAVLGAKIPPAANRPPTDDPHFADFKTQSLPFQPALTKTLVYVFKYRATNVPLRNAFLQNILLNEIKLLQFLNLSVAAVAGPKEKIACVFCVFL